MRLLHRAVATVVAGLAVSTAGVFTPAAATPEDGEGCAGSPDVPATYVCVISLTPENVVPGTTTTNVPVSVPRLCYVAGCTDAATVNVPVPGVTPRGGVVAVIWHKDKYIPIGTGTVDAVGTVYATIDLASETAAGAVTTVNGLAAYAAQAANGAAATALGLAGDAADDVGAAVDNAVENAGEEVADLRDQANEAVADADAAVDNAVENAGEAVANLRDDVDQAVADVDAAVDQQVREIRDVVNGLPSAQEIRDALVEFVQRYLEDVEPTLDTVRERLADLLASITLPCLEYSCIGPK